ncbi:MAG: hypothetical protein ACE5JL_08700, partial [Dehalococcoidia bacterium]
MISGQLAGPYSPSSATPGTAVASRLDTLMEATWLLVIAGVPLLFNRAGEQYFDIYKAALLVLATAFLAALWLVRWTVVPRPAPRGLVPKPLLLPALMFVLLYL